jgi:hypothetical protein
MATATVSQKHVIQKYVSLSESDKSLLREIVTNYLFEMANALNIPIKEIDARDVLYKSLDFVSEGWKVDNATESRWRYVQ